MQSWLLIVAASHAAAASVGTELKSLAPAVVGQMSRHSTDFRLGGPIGVPESMFREIDLERRIAPDAQVGVGMSGPPRTTKDKMEIRAKGGRQGSQGPAISFVLKF
ncbi:MAG TPA: hypothetical protein VNS11_01995 [Sphingomicrobium sp.]|nr:hypothetical protein [Sphingomicrobium sp.]